MKKIVSLALALTSALTISASASALDITNQGDLLQVNDTGVADVFISFVRQSGRFCLYDLTIISEGNNEVAECRIEERLLPRANCAEQKLDDVETTISTLAGCEMFDDEEELIAIDECFLGEERDLTDSDDDRFEGVCVDDTGIEYEVELNDV